MAEGGQVSGRREDLIKNCSPCSTQGTEKAATHYCFMCEASFCQDCTEQHRVFLSKHRVTDIESANVGVPLTLHTEPCPEHGKALKLYCKEDDAVCCDECIDRQHISCKEIFYLPASAHELIKDVDVTEIKSKLRRTIEQIESIKIKQQATVKSLREDRDKCLKETEDYHKELLYLLEKLVQSSRNQIEQTFERFSEDLKRHHQEVEKCLVDLESSEKCLGRNQGNDLTLFMELKKCQNQLKATNDVPSDSLENLKVRGFSVAVDDRLHILLSEIESVITVLKRAPVQVRKKYQIDISAKADIGTCWALGSCVLNDGSVLLADLNNRMLKLVDLEHSIRVKDHMLMQSQPRDVCVIDNSEVAVTLSNTTVVIVNVRPRLTPIRSIKFNHRCAYVAYSKGELLITDYWKILYVYNMDGSLLRKVSTDPSGKEIFYNARHITVCPTGEQVYITDGSKGAVILDIYGSEQDRLVSDKTRGLLGLCLDGTGCHFVCGYDSENVVHVGEDGQILTEVLTSSDGLSKPVSVCYDRLRKRLIVTQDISNHLHVCELE